MGFRPLPRLLRSLVFFVFLVILNGFARVWVASVGVSSFFGFSKGLAIELRVYVKMSATLRYR